MLKVEHCVSIVFVCLTVIVIQCAPKVVEKIADNTTLIKRYRLECIEETRVDPDYIHMIEHNIWNFPQAKSDLVKDWALCVMMKAGLMTRQGVYKMDTALSRVPKHDRDDVEKLIDKCLSTKAIPANEIAFKFIKCYQKSKGNYSVSIL